MNEAVDPDRLSEGTLVDGWRVVRRLDGGAYGTVYQVEKAGAFFALKLARHREQSRDKRNTDERAQRELSCLLSLRHPHIARVWGHGRWPHPTEGYFYLVMDHVEGFTLEGWMEHTRATAHELVVLLDKVFEAVAYMHARGIFHRDLKPSNIMVSASTNEPVVVDYGAAHFPVLPGDRLTDSRLHPGTPRYTSPEAERFDLEHRHDPEARYEFKVTDELYALGVTLYDLLTDPRPESDPHPRPVGSWAMIPAHEVNERVPVALSQFTSRLLERDPARRPVSMEAGRRDLAELRPLRAEEWMKRPLQELPPRAPADAAPKAPSRLPPRRQPGTRILALAALGMSVLLAGGVYLGLRGGAPAMTSEEWPVAPETSSPPQPMPDLEKALPMNTQQSPEAVVPSPCSLTQAPPHGTSQWKVWCACLGVVGTLAASQAGCAGSQIKQSPTEDCSAETVAVMRSLGLRDGSQFQIEFDITHPCVGVDCCTPAPEGKPLCVKKLPFTATSRVISGPRALPPGTLLAGYFFKSPLPGSPPNGVDARWTEATLPDGTKYPVCISDPRRLFEHPSCPGARGMCALAYPTVTFLKQWYMGDSH